MKINYIECSPRGERSHSTKIAQAYIEQAKKNIPITVYGNGEQTRDFTYIDDLINGISLCCNNKNAINQTFNLTYGKSKKINKLIEILKTEFPKIKFGEKEISVLPKFLKLPSN